MHHPKNTNWGWAGAPTSDYRELTVCYCWDFFNENTQSITIWRNRLNLNILYTVTLCKKVTLSITILKFINIWRQIKYHFLGLIDIWSAIKVAGFGIKRYLLKSKTSCFGMKESTSKHWRSATLQSKTSCFVIAK